MSKNTASSYIYITPENNNGITKFKSALDIIRAYLDSLSFPKAIFLLIFAIFISGIKLETGYNIAALLKLANSL